MLTVVLLMHYMLLGNIRKDASTMLTVVLLMHYMLLGNIRKDASQAVLQDAKDTTLRVLKLTCLNR